MRPILEGMKNAISDNGGPESFVTDLIHDVDFMLDHAEESLIWAVRVCGTHVMITSDPKEFFHTYRSFTDWKHAHKWNPGTQEWVQIPIP